MIGWKENEIEIPAQRKPLSRFHRNHLDLIGLAALEARVCGEQILDTGRDGARREDLRWSH